MGSICHFLNNIYKMVFWFKKIIIINRFYFSCHFFMILGLVHEQDMWMVAVNPLASWPNDRGKGFMGRPCTHGDPRRRVGIAWRFGGLSPKKQKWGDGQDRRRRMHQARTRQASRKHQAVSCPHAQHSRTHAHTMSRSCRAHVRTRPHSHAHLAHIMHMWGYGDGANEGWGFLWNIIIIYLNIPLSCTHHVVPMCTPGHTHTHT